MWQERLKNQERSTKDLLPKISDKVIINKLLPDDEGFEETQSLVSESPSQGTSSGCNYETDAVDTAKVATDPVETKRTLRTIGGVSDKLKTLIDRNNRSLARSKSMRSSLNPLVKRSEDVTRKTIIPKRSTSLRKTEHQTGVERSNSRTSLRSSRSSLNSSTSVNTVVKKVPLNDKTPVLKIVNTSNNKRVNPTTSTKPRVPASRSSSSGSSVGPTLVRKPPVRVNGQSFKENLGKVAASSSGGSGSSIKSQVQNSRTQVVGAKNGFMRPTASSATKSNLKSAKIYIGK